MEKSKNFDPLAWAAASNNNAATDNGQIQTGQVNNHQCCAGVRPRTVDDADARAEVMAVVNELVARKINITESYGDWIKVGWERRGASPSTSYRQ